LKNIFEKYFKMSKNKKKRVKRGDLRGKESYPPRRC